MTVERRCVDSLVVRVTAVVSMLLLAALALGSPVRAAGDLPSERDYVGVGKCSSCHKKELIGNQVAAWKKGPHHGAFATLGNEHSARIAAELGLDGPASESEACLSCHVTAFGVPPTRISQPVERSDGVQCESCHGPGRDYRKKKIMSDRERAAAKGLWDAGADAAICESCHNTESPTFDPARYTRADGSTTGFDFELAKARILHAIPEDVKGHYLELEKKAKAEKKARRGK